MNGTSYDKANKILLRQICDVLISQKDITLSNIGTKMVNSLTPDNHNKTFSTSDNTCDHKLVI